jgi:hypothetical protein
LVPFLKNNNIFLKKRSTFEAKRNNRRRASQVKIYFMIPFCIVNCKDEIN